MATLPNATTVTWKFHTPVSKVSESMNMAIRNLAVNSGFACTSTSLEYSYVLTAIGVGEEMAHTSIRIGFGRFTTDKEVDYANSMIGEQVE